MKVSAKNILLTILSVVLGAFFILSAYFKTQPVDYFTNTIFNHIAVSWQVASWAARFFIGLEMGLGVLLLINVFGKRKWVLWVTLFLLVVFSGYLAGLWFTDGNSVDCGCMGKAIRMTPLVSLIKNAILIIITIILIAKIKPKNNANAMAVVLAILITSMAFVLFPDTLAVSKVFKNDRKQNVQDSLVKGKHFVAFFSLTCPHCRVAAEQLERLKNKYPYLPIHVIFMDMPGRAAVLKDFMQQTHLENVPFDFLPEKQFINLSGEYVPSMFLMNGDHINDKIDLIKGADGKPQFDEPMILNWYKH